MSVRFRLESPTRTLTLEAPRGVEVNAGVGDFTAYCRKDLLLQSSEGEVSVCFAVRRETHKGPDKNSFIYKGATQSHTAGVFVCVFQLRGFSVLGVLH